jgi:hypothetical protein
VVVAVVVTSQPVTVWELVVVHDVLLHETQ